ncbi:putative quinol monooxygenase [Variovorax sp. LjRoot290]|jgi:quinol monooxygenase YgiN|uniref:putative quinol monooxygenase n=1 Tax=Variovorax sp. LjRoot290 TaxID=3342316 RepID=UPI003ED05C93
MNANQQLTIVAILRARPGIEDELGRRLGELVAPTRAEAGCINYDLHRSNTDPAVWILYENWVSPEALDLHFATPPLVKLLADVDDMTAEPLQIHRLTMVSNPA